MLPPGISSHTHAQTDGQVENLMLSLPRLRAAGGILILAAR